MLHCWKRRKWFLFVNSGGQYADPVAQVSFKIACDSAWPCSQLLLRQKELELLVIKGKKDPYSRILDHLSEDIKWIRIIIAMNTEDVKEIIYDWTRKKR